MALEGTLQHLWGSHVDTRTWLRSVRASLTLLENAFQLHPREVAPVVVSAVDHQTEVQMEVMHLGSLAEKSGGSDNPDGQFRPLLDFYLCLFERYFATLIAPFIFADRLMKGNDDPAGVIQHDGRVRLSLVADMEQERRVPGLLTEGLVGRRNVIWTGES